ncbi:ankyrin repeat domain-containing protein [Roseisolibacter sp. H3M3-2]|uniref:ankyrin repeat domain-containing protein n=1 Tax=Roseisolibacter sp. H3M3-2 TaxID=3031323 RepID=UPI0023DB6FB0|nr:ankyrin repeat domain-containing protein [Roseisolibacter sp. H3M3-2]MDF1504028.1 ankyrin repeat domain-containing protein [Roseisolibacter sp. H3M3-2]
MYADDHADILTAARAGDTDETAAVLSMDNRLTRVTDAEGRTPLHLAAMGGHAATVELLLHNNADPDARDAAGRTALALAEAAGHALVAALLREAGAS